MKGYLTRRAQTNAYLLTFHKPVIERVGPTGILEPYGVPGDPIILQGICEFGREKIFHVPYLEPLWSHEVHFNSRPIGKPFRVDKEADDAGKSKRRTPINDWRYLS